MNEKLRKLLKQATVSVNSEDREWVFSRTDQKKFAELIVRECASIVENAVDHRESASTYPQKILQHFGIKE